MDNFYMLFDCDHLSLDIFLTGTIDTIVHIRIVHHCHIPSMTSLCYTWYNYVISYKSNPTADWEYPYLI